MLRKQHRFIHDVTSLLSFFLPSFPPLAFSGPALPATSSLPFGPSSTCRVTQTRDPNPNPWTLMSAQGSCHRRDIGHAHRVNGDIPMPK